MYDANNFGLNDDYEYHEIIIDSRDALTQFSPSYSSLNWPKITLGKPLERVAAVKVLQVIIPNSYYPVNSLNNTFALQEFDNAYRDKGAPVLTNGSYSSSEITSMVASALTTASTQGTATSGGPFTYSSTYTSTTQKLRITNNMTTATPVSRNRKFRFGFPNLSQLFTELNNNARTTPRLILGFQGGVGSQVSTGITTSTSTDSGTRTLDSYFVSSVDSPPYIYLNSSIIGSMINVYLNGNGHMIPPNTGGDEPQICSIPVPTTTRGENIIYSDPDPQKWFRFGGNLNFPRSFDFYLTAGVADTPLDLNGQSFIVKLGVLTNKKEFERSFPTSTVGGYKRVRNLIVTK